jgi:hypothetical protein
VQPSVSAVVEQVNVGFGLVSEPRVADDLEVVRDLGSATLVAGLDARPQAIRHIATRSLPRWHALNPHSCDYERDHYTNNDPVAPAHGELPLPRPLMATACANGTKPRPVR